MVRKVQGLTTNVSVQFRMLSSRVNGFFRRVHPVTFAPSRASGSDKRHPRIPNRVFLFGVKATRTGFLIRRPQKPACQKN